MTVKKRGTLSSRTWQVWPQRLSDCFLWPHWWCLVNFNVSVQTTWLYTGTVSLELLFCKRPWRVKPDFCSVMMVVVVLCVSMLVLQMHDSPCGVVLSNVWASGSDGVLVGAAADSGPVVCVMVDLRDIFSSEWVNWHCVALSSDNGSS